jgi:hypothetical protein
MDDAVTSPAGGPVVRGDVDPVGDLRSRISGNPSLAVGSYR